MSTGTSFFVLRLAFWSLRQVILANSYSGKYNYFTQTRSCCAPTRLRQEPKGYRPMNAYTDFLENRAREIYPEDDIDYSQALMEVVNMFRHFDEALDTFLAEHGFTGNRSDVDEKISYIRTKFARADIQPPRNMKKWYTEHKRIQKETAIRICFAFGLTVEESEDFMRRICLLRGFDCHNVEEVIYFYAISNRLSYSEARELIAGVPKVNVGKIDFDKEVLYTSAIVEEIRRFKNPEELTEYISVNIRQFGYNNATAYKYIRDMWKEISAEGGLAATERRKLYIEFNDTDIVIEEQAQGTEEDSDRNGRKGQSGLEGQTERIGRTDRVDWKGGTGSKGRADRQDRAGKSGDSLWEIYLQILGLAGNRITRLGTDRSLKPILRDNELLHAWAEDSFPSRVGLEKILNGEHVSEELVHKTILLLVFYRFWVKSALRNHSYQAKNGDTYRCTCEINKYLMDAGYPELYPGDPFDCIILHAVENDFPLLVFREYMQELFYVKESDMKAKYAET